MNAVLAINYLGTPDENEFQPVTVNPQPDGSVTFSLLSGEVLSVQIDGTIQTRPAGTAGPYECARINGNIAVYIPSEDGWPNNIYPFIFFANQ